MSITIFDNRTLGPAYNYDTTAVKTVGNFSLSIAELDITNGSTAPVPGVEITVYYLFSITDLGDSLSTSGLTPTGSFTVLSETGNSVSYSKTISIPANRGGWMGLTPGNYLYIWLSNGVLVNSVTATLTITSAAPLLGSAIFPDITDDGVGNVSVNSVLTVTNIADIRGTIVNSTGDLTIAGNTAPSGSLENGPNSSSGSAIVLEAGSGGGPDATGDGGNVVIAAGNGGANTSTDWNGPGGEGGSVIIKAGTGGQGYDGTNVTTSANGKILIYGDVLSENNITAGAFIGNGALLEGVIGDAAKDGSTYGRQDGDWVAIGGGGGLPSWFDGSGTGYNGSAAFSLDSSGNNDNSVSIGHGANGSSYGVAVGDIANGYNCGASVGNSSNGYGLGNIALGGNDGSGANADATGGGTFTDTCEIGRGAATMNGALHYRGNVLMDGNGNLYGNGSNLTGITATLPNQMSFDSGAITSDGSGTITANGINNYGNVLIQSWGGYVLLDHVVYTDNSTLDDGNGNAGFAGSVSANSFSGNGSSLTDVTDANAVHTSDIGSTVLAPNGDGSNLTGITATLPNQMSFDSGAITSDGSGTITANGINNYGNVTANSFSGDGSSLTDVTDSNAVHTSDIGSTVLAPNGDGSSLTNVTDSRFVTDTNYGVLKAFYQTDEVAWLGLGDLKLGDYNKNVGGGYIVADNSIGKLSIYAGHDASEMDLTTGNGTGITLTRASGVNIYGSSNTGITIDNNGVLAAPQGYQLPDYSTITSPTEGLMAYNFTSHTTTYYNGTAWV
jgi:hypothetical protein